MNHADLKLKLSRNQDGKWPKKGEVNPIMGTNYTSKMDIDYGLMREIKTTGPTGFEFMIVKLTSLNPGEVTYRDRGYSGSICKGHNCHHESLYTQSSPKYKRKITKQTYNAPKENPANVHTQ